MRYSFTLLILFFNSIRPEGFASGTLVRTNVGPLPIEMIQEGDLVRVWDSKEVHLIPVNLTNKIEVDKTIKITCGQTSFRVDHEQQFCLAKDQWVKASQLKIGDILWSVLDEVVKVDGIKEINEKSLVYTIGIDSSLIDKGNGCFVISLKEILVYNFTLGREVTGLIEYGLKCLTNTLLPEGWARDSLHQDNLVENSSLTQFSWNNLNDPEVLNLVDRFRKLIFPFVASEQRNDAVIAVFLELVMQLVGQAHFTRDFVEAAMAKHGIVIQVMMQMSQTVNLLELTQKHIAANRAKDNLY